MRDSFIRGKPLYTKDNFIYDGQFGTQWTVLYPRDSFVHEGQCYTRGTVWYMRERFVHKGQVEPVDICLK